MIHAVVIEGTPAALARSTQIITGFAGGWTKVQSNLWVIETRMSARDVRDLLTANVRGLQIVVMELSGGWASTGFPEQTNWLKSADGYF